MGTHSQTPLPPLGPHTVPAGHAPPHAGASEIRQVSPSSTHSQNPELNCDPQT